MTVQIAQFLLQLNVGEDGLLDVSRSPPPAAREGLRLVIVGGIGNTGKWLFGVVQGMAKRSYALETPLFGGISRSREEYFQGHNAGCYYLGERKAESSKILQSSKKGAVVKKWCIADRQMWV